MMKRYDSTSSFISRSTSRRATGTLGFAARAAALAVFGVSALALAACDGGNGGGTAGTGGTGGGDTGGTGGGTPSKAHKVDIVFAIDNSRSMADKQEIMSLAMADLLSGLANPPCLLPDGTYADPQPASPMDPCPSGSARQYQPVTDIHIGVISSSLGGHGSDACSTSGSGKQSNDDRGHLLDRLDPLSAGTVPTYQNKGFLAWDPLQQNNPPGESDPQVIAQSFSDMVIGVGQVGCGYESQLESIYRFLVDPSPYDTLSLDQNGVVVRSGVDVQLLEQRKAFLRPDSLVVIVSLSDENDCSTREYGQFFYSNQQKASNGSPFHLPKARAICATDPDNQCCYSCGQADPLDANGNPLCSPDPSCKDQNGAVVYHDELSDNINLRCFDQKRRFGIDFLYPLERYTEGLTSTTVTDLSGQLVANPLFSDLDPNDGQSLTRDPSLVVFTSVVGVPWQLIAVNNQDLTQGFKPVSSIDFNTVLADPYMQESSLPRAGITAGNPINGGERSIPQNDDLQYTCTLPLSQPRDCSASQVACDCEGSPNDNPLCQQDPVTGQNTIQVRAKAYPGVRQLKLAESLGDQAVAASICADQIDTPSAADYAYRPVVSSLLANIKDRLQ